MPTPGKKLWQKLYLDFLSDTIYLRYSTSSPTIDPETGNVYIQDTQGIFAGFTADGQALWEHSLMEEYGRLTFPNGRTASPVVDKDLVITRGITANWGAQGPAADRFYAFDKKTGEAGLVLDSGRAAQGQFLFPSRSGLAGRPARLLLGHGRRRGRLRQRPHRPADFPDSHFQGGHQLVAAAAQQRRNHRHLRHALRAGPDGRR